MARPAKAVELAKGHRTKEEINGRKAEESKIKGSGLPTPPKWLNSDQKKLFRMIVGELKKSDILGKLDVFILQETVIAIDRLSMIEKEINEVPMKIGEKRLMVAKEKYSKIFFRCCNELCLSPQSRAKIAAANAAAKDDSINKIKEVLAGADDDDEE